MSGIRTPSPGPFVVIFIFSLKVTCVSTCMSYLQNIFSLLGTKDDSSINSDNSWLVNNK